MVIPPGSLGSHADFTRVAIVYPSVCQVDSCTFFDNDMGAFYAGIASSDSAAVLVNNSVHGKLWYHKRRPGSLEETFNIPVSSQ
jgi:hypothetical protein